jgi:hypothetical protein
VAYCRRAACRDTHNQRSACAPKLAPQVDCADACVLTCLYAAHRAACVSVQDLSYLLRDNYAAIMRKWLSSAVWLQGNELATLDQYCSPSQPPDPDTRDLILAYKDNQEYSDITGRKLGPMMWDISYGVSCCCWGAWRAVAAAVRSWGPWRAVAAAVRSWGPWRAVVAAGRELGPLACTGSSEDLEAAGALEVHVCGGIGSCRRAPCRMDCNKHMRDH